MVRNPAGMMYASFRHHRQSGVFFKTPGGGQLSVHVLGFFFLFSTVIIFNIITLNRAIPLIDSDVFGESH